jgi:hypothetical protein
VRVVFRLVACHHCRSALVDLIYEEGAAVKKARLVLLVMLGLSAAFATTAPASLLAAPSPSFIDTPICTVDTTLLVSCTAEVKVLSPAHGEAEMPIQVEWICPSNLGIGGHASTGYQDAPTVGIRKRATFTLTWQAPSQPTSYSDPTADNTCTAGWQLEFVSIVLFIWQPDVATGAPVLSYSMLFRP